MSSQNLSSLSGMRAIVTGGAGFIGSHLVERLLKLGVEVTIYDNLNRGEESLRNLHEIYSQASKGPRLVVGDVLDFEKIKKTFKDIDIVFHMAALPSHRLALNAPREYALVDLMGSANMFEAARISEPSFSVLLGSSNKVYGKQEIPFREDMQPQPEGPYGQAKSSAEDLGRQYAQYYNINVPVVRYHHVVGPRSQPDLALSIFVERVINGLNPIVHGHFEEGQFTPCAADWTNIADAVDGTILASSVKKFDIFNLGTGKVKTVLELAELVIKLYKSNLKPELREMLPHEALIHCADVRKAKEKLGFEAKTPFEESIMQYINWRKTIGSRESATYR